MVDTIRFAGPGRSARHSWDLERFYGYKKKGHEERIISQLVKNEKGKYRVFMSPGGQSRIDVELNPHKLLFDENFYN